MTAAPSTAAGTQLLTSCRHCKQTWPPPVPEIGQPIDAAYFQLVMKLCEHLHQKHAKIYAKAFANQLPVQTRLAHLFYLNEFPSTDPEVTRYRDVTRHAIFSMLRKTTFSDAELEAKVAAVSFLNSTEGVALVPREEVLRLLKEVRDGLEERGEYPEAEGKPGPRVILASGR